MKIIQAQEIKQFFNIAILVNQDESDSLHEQFVHAVVERLRELDFSDDYITMVVTNAFADFPLVAASLAKSQEYSSVALIAFYAESQREEYMSMFTTATEVAIQTNTPVLMEGFCDLDDSNIDKLNHQARALADRIYSTVSVMEQIR